MDLLFSVLREVLTPQGGWSLEFVVRLALSALLLFAFVVLLARTFGSRTFASFTSYDFLINVAAGSLVASSILGQNLVEGALGVLCLAVLQWAVSFLSARFSRFHDLVDNAPVVLVYNGQIDGAALRKVRLSSQSLQQKLRQQGVQNVSGVRLAILESGGTISVMQAQGDEDPEHVAGTFPRRASQARQQDRDRP